MQLQSGHLYSSEISQVEHGVSGSEVVSSLWHPVNRVNICPQEAPLAADFAPLSHKVAADETLYTHANGHDTFGPDLQFSRGSTSTSFPSMQSLLSGVPSSINYNMKLLENTAGLRDSHPIDAVESTNGTCTRMGIKGSSLFAVDRNAFIREQLSLEGRFTADGSCVSATSLANSFNGSVENSSVDTQPNNLEPLKYLTVSGDVPLNSFRRFPTDDFSLDACIFDDGNIPIMKPHVISSGPPKRFSHVEKTLQIPPAMYFTSQSHGMSHSSWRSEILECFPEKDILSHASTSTVKLENGDALDFRETGFGESHPAVHPDTLYQSILQSNTFAVTGRSTSNTKLASQLARCDLPARVDVKDTRHILSSPICDEQSNLWQNERGHLHIEECAVLIEEAKVGEMCKTTTKCSREISEVDLDEREDKHVEMGCVNAMLHDGADSLKLDEPVPGQASIVSPEGGKNKKGLPAKNLHAERRRRKKLNERLYLLRSVVPKISKMDRASILGDAIDYLKDLLQQINNLQMELKSPPGMELASLPSIPIAGMDSNLPRIPAGVKDEFSTLAEEQEVLSPKVEVNINEGRAFDIHMVCSTQPGLLLATVKKLDELGLDIQQAVVSCFNGFSLDIFRAEQSLEKDFQPEDIKSALLQAVLQAVGCDQAKVVQHS